MLTLCPSTPISLLLFPYLMEIKPEFSLERLMEKQWKQWQTLFWWAAKSLQMVTAPMKLKDTCYLKESYDQPKQHVKNQRHYFADKCPSSQSYGFSSSRVWMWELDHKESWVLKHWCFWIVVLEKTLESPLNCNEIQPVYPKGSDK